MHCSRLIARKLVSASFAIGLGFAVVAAAPSAASAGDIDRSGCKTKTVKRKIGEIHDSARVILTKSLRPGATPDDWARDFETLVAESVLLVGLCEDEAVLARGCPLCDVPPQMEVTPATAPALLVQWLVKRPVFDGRDAIAAAR